MFGVDVRESAAFWLLAAFAVLFVWIGFAGRLGPTLGALLTPGQLIDISGTAEPAVGGVAAARAAG